MNQITTPLPLYGEFDLAVAGGGFAGFGAACAAARQGLSVVLVERLEVLGGAGSAGGVGNFSYGHAFAGAQGRVFDDVLASLRTMRAIGEENGYKEIVQYGKDVPVYRTDGSGEVDRVAEREPLFYNTTFNHAVLPYVLERIALDAGVEILYATQVVDARVESGALTGIVVHNRSLLQEIRARCFVDATGDGVLSCQAGASVLPGDPEHPDVIQPSNMVFVHRGEGPERMPTLEPELLDEEPDCRSIWPEPDRIGIKMRMFHRTYDTTTGRGYSQAVIDFRRRVPGFVRHFQEHRAGDHGDGWRFEFQAPMFGYRESRRIEGEQVLTVDDLKRGRRFSDSVAYAGSCLDSHHITKAKVPFFQIPLGCFLVRGTTNLLVAGRCFSGTRVALSSTRVMPTACLMGQACGHAAALALGGDVELRAVDPARIRDLLAKDADDEATLRERLYP